MCQLKTVIVELTHAGMSLNSKILPVASATFNGRPQELQKGDQKYAWSLNQTIVRPIFQECKGKEAQIQDELLLLCCILWIPKYYSKGEIGSEFL